MGSRPWRRDCVPPMPALIPIAALRTKNSSPLVGVSSQCSVQNGENNNGPLEEECSPCEREQHGARDQSRSSESASEARFDVEHSVSAEDDEDDDEVRCSASSGADEDDSGAEETEEAAGKDESRVAEKSKQRSRRTSRKLAEVAARRRPSAIDETTSRDVVDAGQAPPRRTRPERHRKSDRRRRVHRSDRSSRRRSSSVSSANTTITTTTTANCDTDPDVSAPATTGDKQPPRVNPIFVWIRQEDTRIVEVRCEDYDKRNRIVLTKTRRGWRAFPRTENNEIGTHGDESDSEHHGYHHVRHHHEHRHERHKNGPGRPRGRRKSRSKKNRSRGRRSVRHHSRDEPEQDLDADGPPGSPRSPTWNDPVNIESHLPSHTIPIARQGSASPLPRSSSSDPEEAPRRAEDAVVEVRDSDDDVDEDSMDSACVNSAEAQAPQCGARSEVSPLDKLLAVTELEYKHQVRRESIHEKEDEPAPPDVHATPELNEGSCSSEATECADSSDSAEDTQKSTSDAVAETLTVDCDYNEDDDEEQNNMSDMVAGIERSLQSPVDDEATERPEDDDNDAGEDTEESSNANEEESVESPKDAGIDEESDRKSQDPEETDDAGSDSVEVPPEKDIEKTESIEDEVEMESLVLEEEFDDQGAEAETVDEEEETEAFESMEQDSDCVIEKSQDGDAQIDAYEQPTDLTISSKALEEELMPTDLSTYSKKAVEEPIVTEERPEIDDMMPTDLSIKKLTSSTMSIEPPPIRPPSQNSETIQSPQPSGIPAVPPSPDIFPVTPVTPKQTANNKSIFLESLLSSASPKLMLNSEITITRNQKEPLDLGKGRKSASPTVTCSEEAKHCGEPSPKRLKIEDITLKNLLHAESKKPEVIIKPLPAEVRKQPKTDYVARMLELLVSTDNSEDALEELKKMLKESECDINDRIFISRDKFDLLLQQPLKILPMIMEENKDRLLISRIYQYEDMNYVAMNLTQLFPVMCNSIKCAKDMEQAKITKDAKKSDRIEIPKVQGKSIDRSVDKIVSQKEAGNGNDCKYLQQQLKQQMQQKQDIQRLQEQSIEEKTKQGKSDSSRKPANGLTNDIDPATTAAFNQMMWLPYLNQQLEAAAAHFGNNENDFLKALTAMFPVPGFAGQFPGHVPPMYGTGRFGMPNAFPMQPPIDYATPHELAMWQEAVLRQKLNNPLPETNVNSFAKSYKESAENRNHHSMVNVNGSKNKYNQFHLNNNGQHHTNTQQQHQQQQQQQQRSHSARTNPIQHNSSNYNRHSSSHNNLMYSASNEHRQNLQIPHYDASLVGGQKMNSSQSYHQQKNSIASPYLMHPSNKSLQQEIHQQQIQLQQHQLQQQLQQHQMQLQQQIQQQQLQQQQRLQHQQQEIIQKHQQEYIKQQEKQQKYNSAIDQSSNLQKSKAPEHLRPPPRVQCRPLQSLLRPIVEPIKADETPIRTAGEPHKPIDLSSSKQSSNNQSTSPNSTNSTNLIKAKTKMSSIIASPFSKNFWQRHDEIAEVGSTTEEMSAANGQLHDTQSHHVWHPLFGK